MKLQEITDQLGLTTSSNKEIVGLNTLNDAQNNELSFLENKKYINDLKTTQAGAVLVKEEFAALVPASTVALITPEPYLMLAYASKLFAPTLVETTGKSHLLVKIVPLCPMYI